MPAINRAPSSQFYWKDWLSDDAVQRMSFDEQGRYMRVLAMTHQTDQPGVCSEEDVRLWASYSLSEWEEHREALARAFKIQPDGTWIQKRSAVQSAAQRRRYEKAAKGGRASAAGPRAQLAVFSAVNHVRYIRHANRGAVAVGNDQVFIVRHRHQLVVGIDAVGARRAVDAAFGCVGVGARDGGAQRV